ncbi:ATP-binding protein [Ramlibacter sp. XY19]|uniref:sensor histidine kinase n=1 Tax=Ramlibacter paludis TaxID=2908000 RepID=UPI0023DAB2D2|nr:ATP-binding protein [Ramlibacter paludis]MCG2595462.1 ATP-binding protein [Ramlibacter paludis]
MSWTLVIWSMLASACLTFALIHLLVWLRDRSSLTSLYFALMCVGTAFLALCEVLMMQSRTPQEFARVVRWLHVPLLLILAALVGFVYVYLQSRRLWLAWTVVGLRALSLMLNFLAGDNISFLAVQELRQVEFLGDKVSVGRGAPNPWMAIGQLSVWLCVAFIVDAAHGAWRRGERGKALGVGLASAFFLGASALQALLIVWGGVAIPSTNSVFCLGIIAVMAYASSRHVLDVRQLAAQLSESEQRMMLAAGAARLGTWSRDLVRGDVWASTQWRELFGFTSTEPVTLDRLVQKVHPDDRQRVQQALGAPRPPRRVYTMEFRIVLPDGSVRWIATQGQADFDARGRPLRMRGASMDCTERRKNEEETRLLRQEIAHVGRISVVGQLAAALAHEINQPLGAILRNAEAATLFLRREKPDLAEIGAILEDIRKDDQRAGAVIDRMRSLLRRQTVEMRPMAVAELFADIGTLLRPEAEARHVKLDIALCQDLPQVAGDRVHLQQVLLNLVANAMDAIDEAAAPSRSVVVSARREGPRAVEIAVSDSGAGIPPARACHLFEPFYTTKAKGMGMGLAISRTIVEAHGGTLRAENAESGGARFLFTVPAA